MSSLQLHTTHKTAAAGWLDSSSELDSTFMQLDDPDEAETGAPQRYFSISATELTQIEFAAQSLHNMFLAATERVMASPELLSKFQIPKPLWSRIKDSWYNSSRQTIAGRMDFAVGGAADIKAFEYNIDTASCLFEAGSTQGRWAEAVGLAGLDGREVGQCVMLPDASVSYSLTISWISPTERRSPAEAGEREMRGGAEGDKRGTRGRRDI